MLRINLTVWAMWYISQPMEFFAQPAALQRCIGQPISTGYGTSGQGVCIFTEFFAPDDVVADQ